MTIGDNCFIGINTTILGKVNIGNNVTIGAHSLVLSDIPDNAVAVGSPAKVIKINDKNPHPRFTAKMGSKKTQINDIQKNHINMLNKSIISLSYRRTLMTPGRRGTP